MLSMHMYSRAPLTPETTIMSVGGQGYIQASYLQLQSARETVFVQRNDATSTTMLRKVATKSRSGDVWVASNECVRNGDAVTVVRYCNEFCLIRTSSNEQGYINSDYLVAGVVMPRKDGGRKTMLRGKADSSRDPSVWEKRYTCVGEGQRIQLLSRKTVSANADFWVIRTASRNAHFPTLLVLSRALTLPCTDAIITARLRQNRLFFFPTTFSTPL